MKEIDISNIKPIPIGNNVICKRAEVDYVKKNGIYLNPLSKQTEFFKVYSVSKDIKDIKEGDLILVYKDTATNFILDFCIVDKYQILAVYKIK